jgi:hypothetical protein
MADNFLDTLREIGLLPAQEPQQPLSSRSTGDLIDLATDRGPKPPFDLATFWGIGGNTYRQKMKDATELAKARLLIESKEATERRAQALSDKDQQLAAELGATYQSLLKQNNGDQGAATKALIQDPIFIRSFNSPHFKALVDHIKAINSGNLDPASTVIQGLTQGPTPPGAENALDPNAHLQGPLAAQLGLNPAQAAQLKQAATLSPQKTADTVAQQLQQRAMPPEPEEDKAIQTQRAKALGTIAADGKAAQTDLVRLQQMKGAFENVWKSSPNGITPWRDFAARYGFDLPGGPNLTDVQVVQSLVDSMVPTARQGLPGAASDKDVAMFKSALPSLMRTRAGNQQIMETLTALAEARLQSSQIAGSAFAGADPKAVWTQLQSQGDPLHVARQRQQQRSLSELSSAEGFDFRHVATMARQQLREFQQQVVEHYRGGQNVPPKVRRIIEQRAAEIDAAGE